MSENSPASPERIRIVDERMIAVTDAAAAKLHALQAREESGSFLRIRVTGGGCSGLAYKMQFVEEAKGGDLLVQSNGVSLLVDTRSALYLKGMTLDYSDKLVAGGFKFHNPNAKASCSCGESFAV